MGKLFVLVMFITVGFNAACQQSARNFNKPNTPKNTVTKPSYLLQINSLQDFALLGGEPLSSKYTDVLSVKLVLELNTKKLYFINSEKFNYHIEFCIDMLDFDGELGQFNRFNYSENSRQEYVLANLNFYRQSGKYALEFTSSTEYSIAQINQLFTLVTNNSFIKSNLTVLVSSDYLNNLADSGNLNFPKLYPSEVYKGQKYQTVQSGVCYGILKKIENIDQDFTQVSPNDILIIKGSPTQIPLCKAIITDVFQTPLSHINVLCHNRKIPAAVHTQIWKKNLYADLVGLPVKLVVNDSGLKITPVSENELAQALKQQPTKVHQLRFDITEKGLINLSKARLKAKISIGNKAASFAELNRLALKYPQKFAVPAGGFAIPFYYYHQHISTPQVALELAELSSLVKSTSNAEAIKNKLKQVRKSILHAPLNIELLELVTQRILANNVGDTYRFRSSSNAEDETGFSGAGLYESKTGKLNSKNKSIEKAIKEVWASAWRYQAYMERSYFGINQNTMMMGILVHKNFPDEASNGVVVTTNLYRKNFMGITVNVQVGEVSVVSPPDTVTCDQLIVTAANAMNPLDHGVNIDYITFSNLTSGSKVLTTPQVKQLYDAVMLVNEQLFWQSDLGIGKDYEDFVLDIEFKFDQQGHLYLKQVRPYD